MSKNFPVEVTVWVDSVELVTNDFRLERARAASEAVRTVCRVITTQAGRLKALRGLPYCAASVLIVYDRTQESMPQSEWRSGRRSA